MLKLVILALLVMLGVLLIGKLGYKVLRWIACRGLAKANHSQPAIARESVCPSCKNSNIHWQLDGRNLNVFARYAGAVEFTTNGYALCIHCGVPYKIW